MWRETVLSVLLTGRWSLPSVAHASVHLNCDGEEWTTLRTRLTAAVGRYRTNTSAVGDDEFPRDPAEGRRGDLLDAPLRELAQSLVTRELEAQTLTPQPQNYMGYSIAMSQFLNGCNQRVKPSPDHTCLFGSVSALYVLSEDRTREPHERKEIRELAKFLLGSGTRYCMDFMDSSKWPLSNVDLLYAGELAGQGEDRTQHQHGMGLFPQDELLLRPRDPIVLDAGGDNQLRVWDIGVHASLSADPLNLWAQYVVGKFTFAHLISDQYPAWLPDKWETLYAENFDRENVGKDIFRY